MWSVPPERKPLGPHTDSETASAYQHVACFSRRRLLRIHLNELTRELVFQLQEATDTDLTPGSPGTPYLNHLAVEKPFSGLPRLLQAILFVFLFRRFLKDKFPDSLLTPILCPYLGRLIVPL